ncbi:MAG: serine/threonine-protein phosphatase [Planctomycetes bacterium]|nr:serine/threonine-protein phosphatase [Planctomycetota bacterium]
MIINYAKTKLLTIVYAGILLLMAIEFKVSAESLQGLRSNNEDAIKFTMADGLFLALVADGMGGHASGEVASTEAIKSIEQEVFDQGPFLDGSEVGDTALIQHGYISANESLLNLSRNNPKLLNMGTTMVGLFYRENTPNVLISNLGDSRCYVMEDQKLSLITADHSFAHALYIAGSITLAQVATHPFRNRIYKYLGAKDLTGGPDVFIHHVVPGQRYLICSDGLSGSINFADLQHYLATEPLEGLALKLCQISLENGSTDNTSAVVIDVVQA